MNIRIKIFFVFGLMATCGVFIYDYSREKLQIIAEKNYEADLELEKKRTDIEKIFRVTYQSLRTISLLPSIRSISPGNRKSEDEDMVTKGRFNPDGSETVQQIYNYLATNVAVSEVYAITKGFDPKSGEVPFFMYDELIFGSKQSESSSKNIDDIPEESEEEEYAEYTKQISQLSDRYGYFNFKTMDEIPAIIGPLIRTCDNTQYQSLRSGDIQNALGFTYSVPFYDKNNRFLGIISAVIRKNVVEAALLNLPFIPTTDAEEKKLKSLGIEIPQESSSFAIVNKSTGEFIADRRSRDISNELTTLTNNNFISKNGKLLPLNVSDQNPWYIYRSDTHPRWAPFVKELYNKLIYQLFFTFILGGLIWFIIYNFSIKKGVKAHSITLSLKKISDEIKNVLSEVLSSGRSTLNESQTQKEEIDEIKESINSLKKMAIDNLQLAGVAKSNSTELIARITSAKERLILVENASTQSLESIKRINQLSKIIGEIETGVTMIEQIAFETKLLAFNASIEAARAEEHGSGFAVVADQVGTLAKNSRSAAVNIRALLLNGNKEVDRIIHENNQNLTTSLKSLEEMKQELSNVFETLSDFPKQIGQIESRSSAQEKSIQGLTIGLSKLTTSIEQIISGTESTLKSSNGLSDKTSSHESTISELERILIQ